MWFGLFCFVFFFLLFFIVRCFLIENCGSVVSGFLVEDFVLDEWDGIE